MKEIISKNNSLIKSLKKQKLKNRFLLFLDNPKTIEEAFDFGLECEYILLENNKQEKFSWALTKKTNIIIVSDEVIKTLTSTKTPQGIIAVFKFKKQALSLPKANFLVLDGLQDAGNIGSLLRSALGANFKDIFLIDCASLTNEKVIRSSMSTIFRLNTYELTRQEFIEIAKKNKLSLVCCDMHGENIYETVKPNNVGIVLGNEGNGVSEEVKSLCFKTISIPMQNNLESLNVAASGAIIMFEINNKGR